jgi:hypothetical protein
MAEVQVGQEVNANDNFLVGDIIIDNDWLPWQFTGKRWASTYSRNSYEGLAKDLGETPIYVRDMGLTTHQLMVLKMGYGPFVLIWRAPYHVDE